MLYLLFILITILFCFFYIVYSKEPLIIFLSKLKLIDYLKSNTDRFYDRFNKIDLTVRNIKTIEDYYKIIEDSSDDIDNDYKVLLKKCIHRSNIFFLNIKEPFFDNIKCYNIPWKIGIIKGNQYEDGMPHTRNDIIILPKYKDDKEDFLTKLLIHEKIHIYQRFFPNLSELYIYNLGFRKYKKVTEDDKSRANPDINEWIYKDKAGQIYKSVFKINPKKIKDVQFFPINKSRYEHPFEKMANDISDKYYTKN